MRMLYFLLQADGGASFQFIMLAAMVLIIYFFFIRPQNKARKEQDLYLTTLEKGNEVVTASGIIGKISKISDKEVTLQVSEKTFIRVTIGSINKELTEAFHKTAEVKKGA